MPTRREREYYQLGFRDGMSFLEQYPDASVRAIASAQEQLLTHPDTIERFAGEGEWARGVLENQTQAQTISMEQIR